MAVREWICDFGKTIDLLLGDLGDQMYHFIHLTLRLFSRNTSENADVLENTIGVLHNITKNHENIENTGKGRDTLTAGLMTSLPVTSRPLAMLLPVMRNCTFCTTTIVRKKRWKNSHFRACAEHTSVTDVTSRKGRFL